MSFVYVKKYIFVNISVLVRVVLNHHSE